MSDAPATYSPDLPGNHVTASDGRKPLGVVVELDGKFAAYDAAGDLVEVFTTRGGAGLSLVARAQSRGGAK